MGTVINSDSNPDEIIEQIIIGERRDDGGSAKRAAPAWLISVIVHLAVLVLCSLIVTVTTEVIEEPAVKAPYLPPAPQPPEPSTPRSTRTVETTLTLEVESDQPNPMPTLDVPVEVYVETDNGEITDGAKGRPDATADSELGREGAFRMIGAGGGAAGMYGPKSEGGKKRAVAGGGGTQKHLDAVDAALRWFKKHQNPDGSWAATTYFQNCTDAGPKCEPGKNHRNGVNEDVGLTGLVLLCYLSAGYDHRIPKYRTTVKKGLDWLISVQQPDGTLKAKSFQYEHAMATMALADAYALSGDKSLRDPAQRAVDVILARRGPATPHTKGTPTAWGDFIESGAKSHTSASSWAIQAIKSAAVAGLDTKDGIDTGKVWLDNLWRASCRLRNIDTKTLDPYTDSTPLAYYYDADNNTADALDADGSNTHALSSIGALLGVFLHADPALVETQANYIMKYNLPTAWPIHQYYSYYATMAMFQLGGDRWKTWNTTVLRLLLDNQRTDGCFNGSWDWEGSKTYGNENGRLLSTALCCLQLEVYYKNAIEQR